MKIGRNEPCPCGSGKKYKKCCLNKKKPPENLLWHRLGDAYDKLQNQLLDYARKTFGELALHLADYGCDTTVVEMLPKIGRGLEAITKKMILKQLKDRNAAILTDTRLLKIEENGVIVANKDRQEQFIKTDKVVIATGTRPDSRLYDQIKSLGYKLYQVGDCLEPRNAKDAIFESAVLGRRI